MQNLKLLKHSKQPKSIQHNLQHPRPTPASETFIVTVIATVAETPFLRVLQKTSKNRFHDVLSNRIWELLMCFYTYIHVHLYSSFSAETNPLVRNPWKYLCAEEKLDSQTCEDGNLTFCLTMNLHRALKWTSDKRVVYCPKMTKNDK